MIFFFPQCLVSCVISKKNIGQRWRKSLINVSKRNWWISVMCLTFQLVRPAQKRWSFFFKNCCIGWITCKLSNDSLWQEELSAKLLEFLESPHATTDILLADKKQVFIYLSSLWISAVCALAIWLMLDVN